MEAGIEVTADMTLIGSNGDTLTFTHSLTGTYQVLEGLDGFEVPDPQLAIHDAPHGSTVTGSRDLSRNLGFTVRIVADGQAAVVAAKRRLESAIRFRQGSPARLFVESAIGQVWTPVYRRQGGSQTLRWETLNDRFGDLPLPLFSPQAHWEAVDPINLPTLRQGLSATLLPHLALMQLGSASASGVMEIVNPGDVDSPVVWKVRGPATSVSFTRDDGQSFTLEGILEDELISVSTRWGDVPVTDQTGANRYDLMAQGPRLFYLPDGHSRVSVSAAGVDADSYITGYFYARLGGVL